MPWYDWAKVEWDNYKDTVPAQLLLFMDLSNNYKKSFQVGQSYVSEPGYYALSRTFQDGHIKPAHDGTSKLVKWGKFVVDETTNKAELCIFNVESITSTMVAVPFSTDCNIIDSIEWIILEPKETWYNILIALLYYIRHYM